MIVNGRQGANDTGIMKAGSDFSFSCPRAILEVKDLDSSEKLVYIAIMAYVGQNETAWPGVPTIARNAGLSVRKVQYCTGSLVSKGYLEKETVYEYTKNGLKRQTTNIYRPIHPRDVKRYRELLQCDAPTEPNQEDGEQSTEPQDGGAQYAPGGCTVCTGGGAQYAPQEINHLELDQENHKNVCVSARIEVDFSEPQKDVAEEEPVATPEPMSEVAVRGLAKDFTEELLQRTRRVADTALMKRIVPHMAGRIRQFGGDKVSEKIAMVPPHAIDPLAYLTDALNKDYPKIPEQARKSEQLLSATRSTSLSGKRAQGAEKTYDLRYHDYYLQMDPKGYGEWLKAHPDEMQKRAELYPDSRDKMQEITGRLLPA